MSDLNRSFFAAAARPGASGGPEAGDRRVNSEHWSTSSKTRSASGGAADNRPLILGLSGEISPEARETFERLLQEFDRLRREVDRRREHEGYLRALVDRHPIVPALSRRALFRELNLAIERDRAASTANTFVMLSVINATGIRLVHGEGAARSMLVHIGETLSDAVRASDVVGVLGGFDFGVLLTLASNEAAERKAKSLAAVVEARRLLQGGTEIALDIAWGLREITAEDSADEIVSAADRDLRQRLAMAARYAAVVNPRPE